MEFQLKYQNRVLKLSDSCNIFNQAREILFRRCLYSSILYLGGSFANSHKNRFDKFTYVYSFISFLFHWQNTHFFQTQISSQHLKVHNIVSFVQTLREKKTKIEAYLLPRPLISLFLVGTRSSVSLPHEIPFPSGRKFPNVIRASLFSVFQKPTTSSWQGWKMAAASKQRPPWRKLLGWDEFFCLCACNEKIFITRMIHP